MLPDFIRAKFTAVLAGRLPIAEFEPWVYATSELETALPPDDYLELISFNYGQRDALHMLEALLGRHVSWGEVQREELLGYLRAIQARADADAVVNALEATYDWYCRGCFFLDHVALSAGLEISCYWHDGTAPWASLTNAQKWAYLGHFYPAAQHQAEEVIGWLETGQIRFEAAPDAQWYINYVDARPGAAPAPEPHLPSADRWPMRPRWWRFWQRHS
ncbi:hypothetical protein LJ737_01890 [Hymenobacter sp. 15J16-1T3B]|uniref:hypothetical protein n=1 Tax=Hymenobacter sp. 15J16-1T3B TaxID=2886941 RepID=UPI001D10615A|nr:hypothetical protein [Hymenobacter sp. 15J16-1T3B]MCC3155970.1 hypothetical protein [Hymenobacter sp. 15J16-1T3B]